MKWFYRALASVSVLLTTFADFAYAQYSSPDSLASAWSAEPGLWPLIKLLLLLALVLGLVWVSLTALKKVSGKGAGTLKGVEVIGGLPLGPRRSLVFVKIGGKVFIVGATDQNLTSIGILDDPAEVAEITSSNSGSNVPQFKDFLGRFSKQANPGITAGGANEA